MMLVLYSIIFFLLAATLLILFHEWGHFFVARLFNIKVLRFAIGFGKPLLRFKDKKNTEYVVALFPIGGYVKMLDQREGHVAKEDLPYAFDQQPVWKRVLVILAGPVANIVLAVFLYWGAFMIGLEDIIPRIGKVMPQSIAAQAGLMPNQEIVAIDDFKTPGWALVNTAILSRIGEKDTMKVKVKNFDGMLSTHSLSLLNWTFDPIRPDLVASLGIQPLIPNIPFKIKKVAQDGPANKAGIKVGDEVVAFDHKPLPPWNQIQNFLKNNIGKPIKVTVARSGKLKDVILVPEAKKNLGITKTYIGIEIEPIVWPKELQRTFKYSFIEAFPVSIERTFTMTFLTLKMTWKMISGQLSLSNLSSVLGIAESAGISAAMGVQYFLSFLALLSISLFVVNILPIPLLDGGHLLFCAIEFIQRKPVSIQVQIFSFKIGLSIVIGLMIIAVYNDILRLLG